MSAKALVVVMAVVGTASAVPFGRSCTQCVFNKNSACNPRLSDAWNQECRDVAKGDCAAECPVFQRYTEPCTLCVYNVFNICNARDELLWTPPCYGVAKSATCKDVCVGNPFPQREEEEEVFPIRPISAGGSSARPGALATPKPTANPTPTPTAPAPVIFPGGLYGGVIGTPTFPTSASFISQPFASAYGAVSPYTSLYGGSAWNNPNLPVVSASGTTPASQYNPNQIVAGAYPTTATSAYAPTYGGFAPSIGAIGAYPFASVGAIAPQAVGVYTPPAFPYLAPQSVYAPTQLATPNYQMATPNNPFTAPMYAAPNFAFSASTLFGSSPSAGAGAITLGREGAR